MGPLPVDRPGKIIAVGLNYRDHASEANVALPSAPVLFAKWPSCLIPAGEPIRIPSISSAIDYEAELAVVIGHTARAVSVDDALDHVLGYICLNDVTARDLQSADGQWTRSKSLDTFGPIGPRLVPAAELADPQKLAVCARLNGELVQDGNTADMIFSVAQLISYISTGITLEVGDIITTGTPAGVGAFRETPLYLRPGDEITVEVEGIGTLSNPIVADGVVF